jgi:transcriptional regulator with XRE-family HTH domain
MDYDLEQYRRAHSLSYAKLAGKIGLTSNRHAMRWALGESWPDADKLARIIEVTGGEVSLAAMHRRRLRWIREHRAESVQDQTVTHVTELAS